MKNIFACFLLIAALSSCSMSVHTMKRGTLDIAKKDTYTVTYKINLSDGLAAKISYTDENANTKELKNITGIWEKTVVLKSGSNVKIHSIASGKKGRGEFKVLVDGNVVSEHILTNKKLEYGFDFDLP